MIEQENSPEEEMEALRARTKDLEEQLSAVERETRVKLVNAELRTHAVRAGMIDLDGLKLIEASELHISPDGEVVGAAVLMASLRKKKPWLFGETSSSSAAAPPPSAPMKKKSATEMTNEEWIAARADMLRNR